MDCAEEVAILKQAVGPVVGGEEHLAFDVLNGRMTLVGIDLSVADDAVVRAVSSTGMQAIPWRPDQGGDRTDQVRRHQSYFAAASGAFVTIGFVIHAFSGGGVADAAALFAGHGDAPAPRAEIAAYLAAILFGGRYVVVKAWYSLRNLRPDMNLLMTVAVVGAAAIGEWFEAATVSFLFALSLAIEGWSIGRARKAIAALLDLAPKTARRLGTDGVEATVSVDEIRPGDRLVVMSGERIPLDGRVIEGSSAVNQAPITGESVPVEKAPGADVFAGTINGDGALTVETTRVFEDTVLSRIIKMVDSAHANRAPAEQWVERFARIYTPIVMIVALLVFVGPPLLLNGDWTTWLYRALVLLVIACPCALVVSTPVSIVAALAAAARAGVLVKGGAFIELPARIRAIAMDKTGTITRARPEVVQVVPLNGHSGAELIARAAALESRSTHPLAQAILGFARQNDIEIEPASDVQTLKGKGLTGVYRGESFWLGSSRYVAERGQATEETVRWKAEAMEAEGNTVVVIGNAKHICGLIAVADAIRPDAREAIRLLHEAGVASVVMLTGDNRATAEAIAAKAGIDEVSAELLPEDKVTKIEDLVRRFGQVAMVGDGVNDAPALARANLGIAMGAIGSDAAIETADVALMSDDISRLPWLIRHSRRTLAVIRQNIAFSLAVKALFFVLTFAGLANLWGAIAADTGASLLVVANALRLLRQ
ncbi:heavy metal translocating P-type ATPase [Rhodopseudomonas palustris]|uniref:P-type Zn(2+) transporter n=2 Tax=Rhodopseudomonas palustris TaxID=1076 RepID=A0A323UJK5_RHOPL|nr:heavy metal translocating P-type ATPase [Rhodopseudomonas palustris]